MVSLGTHGSKRHPPLTWVLNGHHFKATRLNTAPLPPHWCWWPVEKRVVRAGVLTSQLSRTVELGENIQTTPSQPSPLLVTAAVIIAALFILRFTSVRSCVCGRWGLSWSFLLGYILLLPFPCCFVWGTGTTG